MIGAWMSWGLDIVGTECFVGWGLVPKLKGLWVGLPVRGYTAAPLVMPSGNGSSSWVQGVALRMVAWRKE